MAKVTFMSQMAKVTFMFQNIPVEVQGFNGDIRIPAIGETVIHENVSFTVHSVVYATPIPNVLDGVIVYCRLMKPYIGSKRVQG